MASPFATYANATLRFKVATGELSADSLGNVSPATAIVEVSAMLSQKRDPNRTPRPGVDSTAIWLEGYVVNVNGANDPLLLPDVVTPDALCQASWNRLGGQFFRHYFGRSQYGVAEVTGDKLKGYFQVSSFAVDGQSWTETPQAGGTGDRQEAEADSSITAGQVLYLKQSGHLDLASAAAIGTARVCGLAITSGNAATAVAYSTDGVIELPDWTAITGTASLSPGQIYFLDTQPGMLTLTAPTTDGQVVVNVGIALSSTVLSIEIQTPIAL